MAAPRFSFSDDPAALAAAKEEEEPYGEWGGAFGGAASLPLEPLEPHSLDVHAVQSLDPPPALARQVSLR